MVVCVDKLSSVHEIRLNIFFSSLLIQRGGLNTHQETVHEGKLSRSAERGNGGENCYSGQAPYFATERARFFKKHRIPEGNKPRNADTHAHKHTHTKLHSLTLKSLVYTN